MRLAPMGLTVYVLVQRNVSLGLPRLKELLDGQSRTKTPYSILALKEPFSSKKDFADGFRASLNESYLRDILQSTEVLHNPDPFCCEQKYETDKMLLDIYKEYHALAPEGTTNCSKWVVRFVLDRTKLLAMNITIKTVQTILRKALTNSSMYHMLVAEQYMPELVIRIRMRNLDAKQADAPDFEKNMAHLFCRYLTRNIYISGISGMSNAFVVEQNRDVLEGNEVKTKKEYAIQIAGNNLRALWQVECADWQRTYTNNIAQTLLLLGVEAAAQMLYHEMSQVMASSGHISTRHLLDFISYNPRSYTALALITREPGLPRDSQSVCWDSQESWWDFGFFCVPDARIPMFCKNKTVLTKPKKMVVLKNTVFGEGGMKHKAWIHGLIIR
jgi:DNA-directed RNA polymerase beta' subunit